MVRFGRVFGMVNAVPGFESQPEVINGCSDLLVEVFGDRGRHARSAVGMGSLPRNITVEIEALLRLRRLARSGVRLDCRRINPCGRDVALWPVATDYVLIADRCFRSEADIDGF